jgi:hypothetical protein
MLYVYIHVYRLRWFDQNGAIAGRSEKKRHVDIPVDQGLELNNASGMPQSWSPFYELEPTGQPETLDSLGRYVIRSNLF